MRTRELANTNILDYGTSMRHFQEDASKNILYIFQIIRRYSSNEISSSYKIKLKIIIIMSMY